MPARAAIDLEWPQCSQLWGGHGPVCRDYGTPGLVLSDDPSGNSQWFLAHHPCPGHPVRVVYLGGCEILAVEPHRPGAIKEVHHALFEAIRCSDRRQGTVEICLGCAYQLDGGKGAQHIEVGASHETTWSGGVVGCRFAQDVSCGGVLGTIGTAF